MKKCQVLRELIITQRVYQRPKTSQWEQDLFEYMRPKLLCWYQNLSFQSFHRVSVSQGVELGMLAHSLSSLRQSIRLESHSAQWYGKERKSVFEDTDSSESGRWWVSAKEKKFRNAGCLQVFELWPSPPLLDLPNCARPYTQNITATELQEGPFQKYD